MVLVGVIVVAALHVAFFGLEAVFWTNSRVRRLFGNSAEKAKQTRVMALNQGAYNLGIAALLIWLQLSGNQAGVLGVLLFIVAVGLVGGFSASRGIIAVQSLPAAAVFALAVWLN